MPQVVKRSAIQNAVRVAASIDVESDGGTLIFAQEGDWIIYDVDGKVKAIVEDHEYRDKWTAI